MNLDLSAFKTSLRWVNWLLWENFIVYRNSLSCSLTSFFFFFLKNFSLNTYCILKTGLQLLMTGSSHFSKRQTQENYNLGFYYLEKNKLKSVSKLLLWSLQPAWKKNNNNNNSSLSGLVDLLRSNCFKAPWISVTVNGVRLNCWSLEFIWGVRSQSVGYVTVSDLGLEIQIKNWKK